MGSAVMGNGALLAAPDQNATVVATTVPVVVAQNPDAPVESPAQTGGVVFGSSSTSPVEDQGAVAQNALPTAPTSGAITPVAPDYYTPQRQATGEGFSKLPLRVGLTLGLIYDDNINISATHQQSDFLQVLTPTITLETSRPDENHPFYVGVTFDPTIAFYDDHDNNNYVDFHVSANAQYKNGDFLAGVTQSYDTYNGANIQFGGRLFNEVFNTRLYASMPITEKINWDIEGIQTITNYDQGYNNNQWLADTYFDYAITGKLRLGAGGEFGFLNFVDGYQTNGGQVAAQSNNNDQTFQQFNLRAIYAYNEKLSYTGKLGFETRQIDNGASTITPVVDIGALWSPFVHTTLQFDGFRRTVAAIAQRNTNYDYTGCDLALKQGFLENFTAGLDLGYNNSNYINVTPSQTYSGLTYNYYTVRPSITWAPNKHFTTSVYYQYQKNASTIPGSGFEDNQVGISGSVAY